MGALDAEIRKRSERHVELNGAEVSSTTNYIGYAGKHLFFWDATSHSVSIFHEDEIKTIKYKVKRESSPWIEQFRQTEPKSK